MTTHHFWLSMFGHSDSMHGTDLRVKPPRQPDSTQSWPHLVPCGELGNGSSHGRHYWLGVQEKGILARLRVRLLISCLIWYFIQSPVPNRPGTLRPCPHSGVRLKMGLLACITSSPVKGEGSPQRVALKPPISLWLGRQWALRLP